MAEKSMKLTFESKLDCLPLLGNAIKGICSCVIQDELLLSQLELCLVEVVSNVINHAYKKEAGHTIEVIVSLTQNHATFTVIDTGIKNPQIFKKELNTDPQDINGLPESGMGLPIIYQIMDEVVFREEQGKNFAILKKKFNKIS